MRASQTRWAALLLVALTAGAAAPTARERRRALLAANDPQVVAKALKDADPVVARTAARKLTGLGPAALAQVKLALAHPDPLLRRNTALGLGAWGDAALAPLTGAMADRDPLVRQAAVISLARLSSQPAVVKLIEDAGQDEAQMVRDAARMATASSFRLAESIPLPKAGWRFKIDPDRFGQHKSWFNAEFDDSGWDTIEIEQAWQQAGYQHTGVSWYRRTVDLPAREKADRVELVFEGVDESAWVWVNGQYAGEHDIGPEGWDDPFRLDVTELVEWGKPNQITVQAMNTAFAGGIWRPVHLDILERVR